MEFTVYRPTRLFMSSLNCNTANLKLHRERSFERLNSYEGMVKANQEMIDKGLLIPAAIVEGDLDNIFERTNTISQLWSENDTVTVINESAHLSSSSVGDVFIDESNQSYLVTCFEIAPITLNIPEKQPA